MSPGEPVAVRYTSIRQRIDAAARRAGRDPASVTLVGASKFQPVATLAVAYDAGLRVFGENRVQEGLAKAPQLPPDAEWHLLGPLQSNKVRAALRLFRVFHAIDRVAIAQELEREAVKQARQVVGLLEVNLGAEPSKHGFLPDRLLGEAGSLAELSHLRIAGLMAIPPPAAEPELARPWFRRLAALAAELARQPGWSSFPGWLSMGMSDDFEVAIEEGATHVRVGTSLFGPRKASG